MPLYPGAAAPFSEEELHLLRRELLQSIPAVVAFIDRDRRYRYVNAAYLEWTGVPEEELLGRSVREILGEDVYARLAPRMDRALAGEEVAFEQSAAVFGSEERTFLARYLPRRREDPGTGGDEVYGFFVFAVDITIRKRTERERDELLEREQAARREAESERRRLHSLFDQAPALVAVHEGPEHVYVYSNPPHDRAVGQREVLGRTLREAMPELEGQGIFERFDHVFASGEKAEVEEMKAVFDRDGDGEPEEGWFRQLVQPWFGADGEIRGVTSFAFEITELVRARELLEEGHDHLERRIEERTAELANFAYTVSHDLRAPLRGMQGFASALLEDYGEALDETGRDYARRIVRAARRMDELIQDLLLYSQLDHRELRLYRVSVKAAIEAARESVPPPAGAPPARVRLDSEELWVLAHQESILRVLENLLGNAYKFVAPGELPDVEITAELVPAEADEEGEEGETDSVRVTVADRGLGIEEEHLEEIFEVFTRLHGIESYEGTGIGLALVRRTVGGLGGTFGVKSAPGVGSEFWFSLPGGDGEA